MGGLARCTEVPVGPAPERTGTLSLGMPELAMAGLSEPWLLRHLGDRHWRLIADAIGGPAVFRDAGGAPVYAAFCAISIEINRPDRARPGAELSIRSRLGALSATRLFSHHALGIEGKPIGQVRMISAFLGHDETGRNRALRRARPVGLPMLPPIEDPLAAEAAAIVRGQARFHLGCALDAPPRAILRLTPSPAEFNAAGLLYFPSFPALADQTAWRTHRTIPPGQTAYRRDILYSGNLDLGEDLAITLTAPSNAGETARLTRADGTPLALIVTRRDLSPVPVRARTE